MIVNDDQWDHHWIINIYKPSVKRCQTCLNHLKPLPQMDKYG